ncbi:protein NRT1/ PTR FAMILY 2.3-like isoform X1 [Typha angustifolia]|uniref:protein NRT1/ PTR FAMILY 2.3-like isoform X1 n=1 Tax=Typha angustifolia TaxID=59011 RepID=UPI003C30CAF6
MEDKKASQEDNANEAQMVHKQGGWITFPFITGSMLGLSLAISGVLSNFIVYLIEEYNVKSIDAAQISNIIGGCTGLAPVVGAVAADAYFGCFPVVAFSSVVSVLSLILFTLSATIRSLRPVPCTSTVALCKPSSTDNFAILYAAVALLVLGVGGSQVNIVTMGANQFDKVKDQDIFFNWYYILLYLATIIGATIIVYIQDNVSWGLGFGLCTASNAVSLLVLLLGGKYYARPVAQGSPFSSLAQVVMAAIRKRKVVELSGGEGVDHYHGRSGDGAKLSSHVAPSQSFRFLNCAAVITPEDIDSHNNSNNNPWKLCSVEQVEDLKKLIRLIPLWTSTIFVSISVGIQSSFTVLQALTMNRSLGPHFTIPAGSIGVSVLATVVVTLTILDRLIFPLCHNFTLRTPTTLQRIGAGFAFNIVATMASALVERTRINIVWEHHKEKSPMWIVPMSAMWLLLPLAVTGFAEALHFPGQVAFYYQEFPKKLKSTATGMVALFIALGFYLSTAVVDLVRKATDWLPDNINGSKLENVYWMLTVVGVVNFGYYLMCARLYVSQSTVDEKVEAGAS